MGTHNNPPTDFESIHNHIKEYCEKLTLGYERINYLKRIMDECKKIIEFQFYYENEMIDEEALNKIMPGILSRFYAIIENREPGIELSKEPKFIYLEGAGEDYASFYQITEKLLSELKIDFRIKEEEMKTLSNAEVNMHIENRIKITSSLSDVVRILSAMIRAKIISMKTEVKQFAQMFFSEPIEQINFEKKYNATYNRIKKEESSTKSEPLVEFVITLCKEAFKNKPGEIEIIITELEKI